MDDLFSSWLDEKKLFEQLYDLAQAYHRPVLIIEGGGPVLYHKKKSMSRQ